MEKYLNLQNAKRNSYVCRFSNYSLVHKCRNQDCVHCTVKGYTSRDICRLPPPKLHVDCSFIKAEHSTQVSSKNNSMEKILVLPNNSPYHHLFHKVSICHLLNSRHKFLHIYCLQRSVLPSKNTVFESCKTTSLLLFMFSCSVL